MQTINLLNQCISAINEINEILDSRASQKNKDYVLLYKLQRLGDRHILSLVKYDKQQPLMISNIDTQIGEFKNKYHLYIALDTVLNTLKLL